MAVEYVWPPTLLLPRRPPKLVYLDLNHWITLAKVDSGRHDGAARRDVLDACLDAADKNIATFPIADTTYVEISKIGPHRQRRDLRNVIERLSRFAVVTSRSAISTHEIEALLDRLVGPSPTPINTMHYLDWGVARAMGWVGGFKVRDEDGRDTTTEARAQYPGGPDAFDRLFAAAELWLNRRALEGPRTDEEPVMRELGWDPLGTDGVTRQRLHQEIEQVERFNQHPQWRRGRLRDVTSAREIIIEVNEILFRGLKERSAELEDVFPTPTDVRAGFDALPSFDVAVTLKTSYHRDPAHRWTTNDIHDIDALSSTVPYCDVVVTDKAVASHLRRHGLDARMNTVVLSRLQDLPTHLGAAPS
jgi:hypothetical protein